MEHLSVAFNVFTTPVGRNDRWSKVAVDLTSLIVDSDPVVTGEGDLEALSIDLYISDELRMLCEETGNTWYLMLTAPETALTLLYIDSFRCASEDSVSGFYEGKVISVEASPAIRGSTYRAHFSLHLADASPRQWKALGSVMPVPPEHSNWCEVINIDEALAEMGLADKPEMVADTQPQLMVVRIPTPDPEDD